MRIIMLIVIFISLLEALRIRTMFVDRYSGGHMTLYADSQGVEERLGALALPDAHSNY